LVWKLLQNLWFDSSQFLQIVKLPLFY
jgi:hypothetical protein